MGDPPDARPAYRRAPTQHSCVVQKLDGLDKQLLGVQQSNMLVLTGQAHILQLVEQTGIVSHATREEVQHMKAMYEKLVDILLVEYNKQVDEACSPMPSRKEIRRRSPDTDSRGGAMKAPRGVLFPEPTEPQESVEQPESPKSPMILVADLKRIISDPGECSSTTRVAENQSPLSTISSIMKKSPGGEKLLADWLKVLE